MIRLSARIRNKGHNAAGASLPWPVRARPGPQGPLTELTLPTAHISSPSWQHCWGKGDWGKKPRDWNPGERGIKCPGKRVSRI